MIDPNTLTCVGFDLETTGTDIETDRIVTATLIKAHPGMPPVGRTWVIDPGIDIPDEAAAVHGWTTERVRGLLGHTTPGIALPQIRKLLLHSFNHRTPVVAYNAQYDFSLLHRELDRHGCEPIVPDHGQCYAPVIDPRVLDKHLDPYRKNVCGCGCGATDRTLTGVCQHYGVTLTAEDAHSSEGDARAAVDLVRVMLGDRFARQLSGFTVEGLHDAQVKWWAESQRSFAKWNREKNESKYTGIREEWPVIPPDAPVAPTSTDQGALL